MEHTVVNGSVHTAFKGFACKFASCKCASRPVWTGLNRWQHWLSKEANEKLRTFQQVRPWCVALSVATIDEAQGFESGPPIHKVKLVTVVQPFLRAPLADKYCEAVHTPWQARAFEEKVRVYQNRAWLVADVCLSWGSLCIFIFVDLFCIRSLVFLDCLQKLYFSSPIFSQFRTVHVQRVHLTVAYVRVLVAQCDEYVEERFALGVRICRSVLEIDVLGECSWNVCKKRKRHNSRLGHTLFYSNSSHWTPHFFIGRNTWNYTSSKCRKICRWPTPLHLTCFSVWHMENLFHLKSRVPRIFHFFFKSIWGQVKKQLGYSSQLAEMPSVSLLFHKI